MDFLLTMRLQKNKNGFSRSPIRVKILYGQNPRKYKNMEI